MRPQDASSARLEAHRRAMEAKRRMEAAPKHEPAAVLVELKALQEALNASRAEAAGLRVVLDHERQQSSARIDELTREIEHLRKALVDTLRVQMDKADADAVAKVRPTRDMVIRATARVADIDVDHLISHRRHRDVARWRQLAAYACKLETLASFPQIGRALGGRDHTTILHAVKKIDSLVQANDSQTVRDLEAIRAAVAEAVEEAQVRLAKMRASEKPEA